MTGYKHDDCYVCGTEIGFNEVHFRSSVGQTVCIHCELVEDGFGSSVHIGCPTCGQATMQVVRPGKFQCGVCE